MPDDNSAAAMVSRHVCPSRGDVAFFTDLVWLGFLVEPRVSIAEMRQALRKAGYLTMRGGGSHIREIIPNATLTGIPPRPDPQRFLTRSADSTPAA